MFTSILTIDQISADYDGKFKVILKNHLGEAVSVAQVNVKQGTSHSPPKNTLTASRELCRVSFSSNEYPTARAVEESKCEEVESISR